MKHNGLPDLQKIMKLLFLIVPIGVVCHLVFVFSKTEASAWAWVSSSSKVKMLLAILLTFIPWFLNSMRVWIWTRFLRNPLTYQDCLAIVIASDLGSAVTPTAVGGGYVKMGMLIWNGFPAGEAASLMLLGSFENYLFFMVAIPVAIWVVDFYRLPLAVSFVSMAVSALRKLLVPGIGLALFTGFFLFIFARSEKHHFWVSEKYVRFRKKIRVFINDFTGVWERIGRRGQLLLIGNVFLAAIQWTSRYTVVSVFLSALGIPVDPVLFFVFQWLIFSAGTFFPLPGGSLGVEAAFYFIYKPYIPEEILAIAMTGWRFMTYYLILLVGLLVFPILIWFKLFFHLRKNME